MIDPVELARELHSERSGESVFTPGRILRFAQNDIHAIGLLHPVILSAASDESVSAPAQRLRFVLNDRVRQVAADEEGG